MDRPRPAVRLARVGGLAAVGITGIATAGFLLVPLAARGFVRAIEELAAGCIWLAASISSGMSPWTMLATVWRAAAASLAAPVASAMLWGLVLVGLIALYGLQRLMGPAGTGRIGRQGQEGD
jgi:hypothetical protein